MAGTKQPQAEAPQRNGAGPADAPSDLPRAEAPPTVLTPPRREVWADMPEDEYPGFKFRMWKNYPSYLLGELLSGDEGAGLAVMKRLVLEHNGWGDADGNLLPQPSDDEFWRLISNEQAAMMITVIQQESVKLPNSVTRRRPS